MIKPDAMILTIAHKEFRSLFAAPSTWFILGALQFIFAWFFLVILDAFLQEQSKIASLLNPIGATQFFAVNMLQVFTIILMILVPIFTMRLIADERRSHVMPLLMAAPVSDLEIILGKFLGVLLFLSLINAACFTMLLTLTLGVSLDFGLIFTNALGILLLTACYTALGLYFSTLTNQPIVAALSTIATLFGLWLIDFSGSSVNSSLQALSPTIHFQSFNSGLLLSYDFTYFVLMTMTFLFLAVRRLHNIRIYG